MKPLLLLILAVAGLAGCVAVPVEGPRPGYVVAPPPPLVVVRPYPYYRYGWHRRWY